MADTGYLAPATGAKNYGDGFVVWTNPQQILAVDGLAASVSVRSVIGPSEALVALDFNAQIPTDQFIHGVASRWLLRSNALTEFVYEAVLWSGGSTGSPDYLATGSQIGTSNTEQTALTTTLQWIERGGPTDRWGLDLTPETVNAPGFGTGLMVFTSANSIRTVNCDAAELLVYYGPEPPPADDADVPIWKRGIIRLALPR